MDELEALDVVIEHLETGCHDPRLPEAIEALRRLETSLQEGQTNYQRCRQALSRMTQRSAL